MKMNLQAFLPLLLCSSVALADEYRSISNVIYNRTETGSFEHDAFRLGSTWYFDDKETLGPLNEFEYINTVSNVFGSYSRSDSFPDDIWGAEIGGEYFAGNVLLGGSYENFDGDFDAFSGTVGYLFSDNFLVSLDAVKAEDFDTNYFINARYNHQLGGTDYIGFNLRVDDEFDRKEISSRYFTRLAGGSYLAAEASYAFSEDGGSYWTLHGDYYFNERTSLGLGAQKDDAWSLDFTHFFNENVAMELGYMTRDSETPLDVDMDGYQLGMTVQF